MRTPLPFFLGLYSRYVITTRAEHDKFSLQVFPEELFVTLQDLFRVVFIVLTGRATFPHTSSSPAAADHSSFCKQATRSASFPSASFALSRRKTWSIKHLPSHMDSYGRFQSFS